MVPGVVGMVFTVIAKFCAAEDPQALVAITEIVPLVASAVAEIELVVDVPLQPPGKVQEYELADGSLITEYVLLLPEQMVDEPEIEPGVEGLVFTVMANVCADDEPQALFAVTVMLPAVEEAVVLIELVADVPVQPLGRVQV